MIIREATEKDIPEIVEVLKASLGETDLPLSEEIWRYKHIDNPFGKSIVLVAEEDQNIIGVRAFMRWKWQSQEKVYSALRAVDTATHPQHQGKGIFKKLTLKAVEVAKDGGEAFIFNTPNEKSRSGYLKMGWKSVGKIKVGLRPAFHGVWRFKNKNNYSIRKGSSGKELDDLCQCWNSKLEAEDTLYTPKSSDFLSWRYEANPLQKYEVVSSGKFYLAGYVKKRKGLKELRIAESIYDKAEAGVQEEVIRMVKQLEKKFGAQFLSFSPDLFEPHFPKFCGKYGPILTLRNLNLLEEKESAALEIESWNNSLGDLELF